MESSQEAGEEGAMTPVEKRWRVIVIGGHTRSIGKTQLVCDVIAAFPEANWIAGKITQYGHGFCVKKGKHCDCAPDEHICAISWENGSSPRTDSGRFLTAGARKSFWLRTKQGYLAEGIPLLRAALEECERAAEGEARNLILESNTLLDFVTPSLYLVVLDPTKGDFKQSARVWMDRASAFVLRGSLPGEGQNGPSTPWAGITSEALRNKPGFLQREGETLPGELRNEIHSMLQDFASISV
jgi:hypothetical protein